MKRKLLLLIWIFFIFYLSSTSAIKVTAPETWMNPKMYSDSVSLIDLLDEKCKFYYGYIDEYHTLRNLGVEFYSRKVGHVLLYSILSILILINTVNMKHYFKLTWLFTTLIAFIDECNQYLMIGRSGRLIDVALDSVAALVILTILYFWSKNPIKKVSIY